MLKDLKYKSKLGKLNTFKSKIKVGKIIVVGSNCNLKTMGQIDDQII